MVVDFGVDFNALVYMNLDDPLESRRVKSRKLVRDFDALRTILIRHDFSASLQQVETKATT